MMALSSSVLASTNWVKFFGHFHPLLLHLPIGFLVLLGLMEITGYFKKYSHIVAARGFILVLLVGAAIVTVTCGWLLASGGGYNHRILFWHRWLGTSVAALSVILLAVWLYKKQVGVLYYGVLGMTLVALVLAAHFGGDLTFGSRYLDKYAPPYLKPLLSNRDTRQPAAGPSFTNQDRRLLTGLDDASTWDGGHVMMVADEHGGSFYERYIQRAFNDDCIRCHGRNKQKGHLRLDSYWWLRHGRRGRPVIIPGDPARSRLYQMISKPYGQRHHMPPRGHRQLTKDQIILIRWWIASGASGTASLRELHPPTYIRRVLQSPHATGRAVETPRVSFMGPLVLLK